MMKEKISNMTQAIKSDLELLRNKHVYELERIPGMPKCSTLANRIEEKIEYVLSAYEELFKEQAESADKEQFNLLYSLLEGLVKEVADLSKKQPDGLVNAFKVRKINSVLIPIMDIMKSEMSASFLDLVSEVDEGKEKSRNSYSDVAVILSQYTEACKKYRVKYYSDNQNNWLKLK